MSSTPYKMRMKKRRSWIATALVIALGCSSIGSVALAAPYGEKDEHGWRQDNGVWSYFDSDGEMVKNDFRISPTGSDKIFTVYYLGEDGHLVLQEGGSTITTPDGRSYELTPGGALTGGSLYVDMDGYHRYTEPDTGRLASAWRRIKDENGKSHWYFFDQISGEQKGVTRAYKDPVKGISKYSDGTWKMYHFNEDSQMAESELVQYNIGGYYYGIYAQNTGELARNKWLYFDDAWHYFQNEKFGDWDPNFGIMATSDAVIDNENYTFDEDGRLISDNAPYANIEEIELSTKKESVYVGDTVAIKAEFSLASTSNASAEVATGSNATVMAIMEDKAYDVNISIEQDGREIPYWNIKLDEKLSEKTGTMNYTYKPTMDGEIKVNMMVDGVMSDPIYIDCSYNKEKTETPDYMKVVFDGIRASGLSGQEIIAKTAGIYSELSTDVIAKLREDDGVVGALAEFEKLYITGQGIDPYKEDFAKASNLFDSGKVEVVGAFLNTDFSGNQVTMSMETTAIPAEAMGLEGSKKAALDISLSGGVRDTSNLEIPVTITMPVPKGFSNEGLKLYHRHNGEMTELRLSESLLKNGQVRFTTNGFSDFVFAGTPKSSGGSGGNGSGSGGGSTSGKASTNAVPQTPGSWKATEQGWQFVKSDGSLYVNEWLYVGTVWYYVDANDRMGEGWQSINGKWYYLTPVSGFMVTGWKQIDGVWYYLSADGSMLANTKTPDGYQVNESGAWIQ